MLITHEEMRTMNRVQTGILREVAAVCRDLNVRFFMVHGSLLGTLRCHGFIPDDDDIDICMPREDYEIFLEKAQSMLPGYLFVQTNTTDSEYPLSFAKVRDSRTTYIVEASRKIPMNHGMFIDIFPLDFAYPSKLTRKAADFRRKLLDLRITSVMDLHTSAVKRAARFMARCIYPDYHKAQRRRDALNSRAPQGKLVNMTGGKGVERAMPAEWFFPPKKDVFEGLEVFTPSDCDAYLTHIYGDYRSRTLVESKRSDDRYIEVNACVVDADKPYTYYLKQD